MCSLTCIHVHPLPYSGHFVTFLEFDDQRFQSLSLARLALTTLFPSTVVASCLLGSLKDFFARGEFNGRIIERSCLSVNNIWVSKLLIGFRLNFFSGDSALQVFNFESRSSGL